VTPADWQAQHRRQLVARIGADRQAIGISLDRLGEPLRVLERLRRQALDALHYLPLLMASLLLLWWLRRAPKPSPSMKTLAAPDAAMTIPLRPAVAVAGRSQQLFGLIQQLVNGWRLAVQIQDLLRLPAATPIRTSPISDGEARTGPPQMR
jgi:hypothetical protein